MMLILLWLGLSGGHGWLFGLTAVAAALVVSGAFAPLPVMHISVPGLVRFLGFFLYGSLVGAVDVARRALAPRLTLDVHHHRHPCALPAGPPRAVLIGVVSLLPGTLSVRLEGDVLLVHSIAGDPGDRIERLEQSVAGLFRIPVVDQESGGAARD